MAFDWDIALSKVTARLARLQGSAAAAATAAVQDSEAEAARKVEEDLAALVALLGRKKAFETSTRLGALLPLLDDEAEIVLARAFAADDTLRFEYDEKLRAARARRESQEKNAFIDLLMKLDYRRQEEAFTRLVRARRSERVAPVVLCGDQEHGLYWLLHRLRRHIPPSPEPPFVVHFSFRTGALAQDIAAVCHALARRLGLPTHAGKEAIFEKLCDRWRSTHLVFVLSRVESLGAAGFSRLLDDLWRPLVEAAHRRRSPTASTWLTAFFLHEGDPSELDAAGVACAPGEEPFAPVLLPRLAPFDDEVRERWQSECGPDFPESMQDDGALARIFEEAGFVPGEVLYAVCRLWEYDFTVLGHLWERP